MLVNFSWGCYNMLINKKGNLLSEETLKIIVALVCIILLVSLLSGIYNNYTKNKQLEMAKSTLSQFKESASLKHESFDAFNPVSSTFSKFYLVSWNEGIQLPNNCANVGWVSCVCICRVTGWERAKGYFFREDILTNLREECPKWACLENTEKITLKPSFIELDNSPTSLKLEYFNEGYVEVSKNGL